jgi:hypothetical protein
LFKISPNETTLRRDGSILSMLERLMAFDDFNENEIVGS